MPNYMKTWELGNTEMAKHENTKMAKDKIHSSLIVHNSLHDYCT